MKDTRSYTVYPSNLDLLVAFTALREMLNRMSFREDLEHRCSQVCYSVSVGGSRRLQADNFADFLDVLRKFPRPQVISTHGHWKRKDTGIKLDIDVSGSGINVGVDGDLAIILGIHDEVKHVFGASNPEPERSPALSRYNLKKSIFLAHRFDDQGNAAARTLGVLLPENVPGGWYRIATQKGSR